MTRLTLTTFAALIASTAACANQTHEGGDAGSQAPAPESNVVAAVAEAEALEEKGREPIAIRRSLPVALMSEVVPDPDGGAALTLDRAGEVRLWTDLMAETVEAPLQLPVQEPVWMSLARTKTGFVAAFIDTAGGTQVGRITAGPKPSWTPLFEVPASEPQFELHVLRGGERIVALGVDHRIQIWNDKGAVVSMLDQPGFVPWQLRLSQPRGSAPKILAVLAGPVRVQPLRFEADAVAISGEPRAVALDRGPNRNDLAMSPDGQVVTALRRPKARGHRFELEFIELETGKRTIVAAESDVRKRPRVHPISASRVLLETGEGTGAYVEQSAGVPWPPVQGEPNRELIENTPLSFVALPASNQATRMHSAIASGLRIVPTFRALVIDRLAGEKGRTIEIEPFSPTAVALDATGERVVWATEKKALAVEPTSGATPPKLLPGTQSRTKLVAFADADHVVALDDGGRVTVRDLAEGHTRASGKLAFEWGIAKAGFRAARDGAGASIILSSTKPSEPLHIMALDGVVLGATTTVTRANQAQWPEAGKPKGRESRDWIAQIGLSWEELDLRPGEVKLTPPDPTGALVLIAQKVRHHESFDVDRDTFVTGPHDYVLTMYDAESNERLWTRPAAGLHDVVWSADGGRLGLASGDGGFVFTSATGEIVHERHDLGLRVTEEA